MGPWVAGSNFYIDCIGYVGQNSFHMGQPTFYVGHNFYLGQFLRTNMFLHRLKFLRGSKIFAWVQSFYVGQLLFTRGDYFTMH